MAGTSRLTISMTCPKCGGQVSCDEGESLVLCKYCDSVYSLEGEEGASRVMYELKVTKEKAQSAVRSWMREGGKAKDLQSAGQIDEIYPMYIPFWRLAGRGKACVCGYDEHKDKDGHVTREPKEALINRDYAYTEAACAVGDLGLDKISIPNNAQARPFEDGDIITFAVSSSKDDALVRGKEEIIDKSISDGSRMDNITFSKGFFFPQSFTLLYYPFWIIRFTYQEKSYFATVDGIRGTITSGRAPGSPEAQAMAAGAGGMVSGLLTGLGFGAAVSWGDNGIYACLFGLIIAAVVFFYGYNRFRYGDEIITGDLEGKGVKVGKNNEEYVVELDGPSFDHHG